MKPTTVYVETNEDWHPSYIIGNKKFLRVRSRDTYLHLAGHG